VQALALLFGVELNNPDQLWQDINKRWPLGDRKNFDGSNVPDKPVAKTYSNFLDSLLLAFDREIYNKAKKNN